MDFHTQKKVLFVVNYLWGGGVERMLVNMIKCIHNTFDVEVLTIYDMDSFYRDEVKRLVNVHTLDFYRKKISHTPLAPLYSRWFDREFTHRLLFKRYINKRKYDTIVAFSEGYAFKLVALTSIPDTKKIAWIHTDYLNDSNWVNSNKKNLTALFAQFDDAVFVCEHLRQKFTNLIDIKSTRCINNGIDIDRIQLMAESPFQKFHFDGINIISVGRLSQEKGHDRLIRAISALDSVNRQKCHLTIVGGGPIEEELQEIVKINGMQSIVTFVGAVSNPYPYIKNADVLFLASKYEGFGLVLIEAMALGTPVVATKTVGASSVTDNGKYGILIENTQEAINDMLKSLIININQLNEYKQKLTKCAEIYSMSNFRRTVIDYFKYE